MLGSAIALTSITFVFSVLAVADASATAQRTFVSSTGNDVNLCSLAQPCRGFARAMTQTGPSGEVIVLDSAGYGPVTITKSVSLIAPAGIYAGITVSSGDGIIVNAPGATIVLRGLSINGQGGSNGVNVLSVARLRIESCIISKMADDGVTHSAPGAELIVLDTIVRDNGGSGIGGDVDASVVLDHVRSEHNGTHGFYMASLLGEARAMISESVFAFNGSNGVWVAATGTGTTFAQVERSVLADNGGGGIKINSALNASIGAVVTRNAIQRNTGTAIAFTGPGYVIATVSENSILRNSEVGVSADGTDTYVDLSANSIAQNLLHAGTTYDFVQSNNASVRRYGNNVGVRLYQGTISLLPAF